MSINKLKNDLIRAEVLNHKVLVLNANTIECIAKNLPQYFCFPIEISLNQDLFTRDAHLKSYKNA